MTRRATTYVVRFHATLCSNRNPAPALYSYTLTKLGYIQKMRHYTSYVFFRLFRVLRELFYRYIILPTVILVLKLFFSFILYHFFRKIENSISKSVLRSSIVNFLSVKYKTIYCRRQSVVYIAKQAHVSSNLFTRLFCCDFENNKAIYLTF